MGIIFKLKTLLPTSALLTLYYAIAYPHLLYGLTVWASTCQTYLKSLRTLQNKAVKIIGGGFGWVHVTPFYCQNEILNIDDIVTYETAKLMHQYTSRTLPEPFENYFTETGNVHSHFTRGSSVKAYTVPRYTTSLAQKSFKYQDIKIWQSVPAHIKKLSYAAFKVKFKSFLISKYKSQN